MILEIYALHIDYEPRAEASQKFFKTVQNKMHFSAHRHTGAEVIYCKADIDKDFIGQTSWTGALLKRTDAGIAKSYLSPEELAPTQPYRQYLSWFCGTSSQISPADVYERTGFWSLTNSCRFPAKNSLCFFHPVPLTACILLWKFMEYILLTCFCYHA